MRKILPCIAAAAAAVAYGCASSDSTGNLRKLVRYNGRILDTDTSYGTSYEVCVVSNGWSWLALERDRDTLTIHGLRNKDQYEQLNNLQFNDPAICEAVRGNPDIGILATANDGKFGRNDSDYLNLAFNEHIELGRGIKPEHLKIYRAAVKDIATAIVKSKQ